MKHVVVAPVGDNLEALYVGIKEFSTDRVILITPEDKRSEAEEAQQKLNEFRIETTIYPIKGPVWESMFKAVNEITRAHTDQNVIVNVATGDPNSRCAATSAAFVNGLKAFSVDGDKAGLLPVLKFSYYKLLSDKKMGLLDIMHKSDCCASLDELSKKSNMSLPLISYHVNGNLKSEGLKELGLVDTHDHKGRVSISLSTLGRLLVEGNI